MLKVNFLLIFGMLVITTQVLGRNYPVYQNKNQRIGLNFKGSQFYDSILATFNNSNDFFDNFFNVNGKDHDKGADFMLTSDVYQKPNPYYTKKANSDNVKRGIFPVYMPKRNDTNSVQESSAPGESYQSPPTAYDEKTHTYNTYLPPSTPTSSSYGGYPYPSSSSEYGPPIYSTYGPPSYSPTVASYPQPNYGPPTSPHYQTSYYPTAEAANYGEVNHQKSHEGFFLKLIKKFDLVILSKILLKLIIFKKIIKFIAIICILLFLPTIKKKFMYMSGDYSDDEDRKYKLLDSYGNVDFRVKEIANFALTAIEGFETHQIPWCVGESELYCRIQYMIDQVDFRYPGLKMLSLWFPALTTTVAPPSSSSTTTTVSSNDDSLEVNFNDYITDSSETLSSIENANEEETKRSIN